MKKSLVLIGFCIIFSFANADAAILQKGMGENQCSETNTIHVGDTVIWTNYYDRMYQVTSVDIYDHPDGNFDSGYVKPGNAFSYTFYEIGEFLYFCAVPHEKHGIIIVSNSMVSQTDPVFSSSQVLQNLTNRSSDGSLLVNLEASTPKKDEIIPIQISFSGKYNEPIYDLDFIIIALQERTIIPISNDGVTTGKKIAYKVGPLVSDGPLTIQIKPLEIGHPNRLNYLKVNPDDTIILQTADSNTQNDNSLIHDARALKIPDWLRIVFSWYDTNLVTEYEMENAIKYLSNKGIIHLN